MVPKSGNAPANPANIDPSGRFGADETSLASTSRTTSDKHSDSVVVRQATPSKSPLPLADLPEPATLPHTAPALAARSVSGAGSAVAINTEPQMIAEGVFIGEGRAKSGEKVFLKMERVTKTNQPRWTAYCQSTAHLTLSERSVLTAAMRTTKAIAGADGQTRFVNDRYDQLAEPLGYNREEFEAFIDMLGRHNFAWSKENKPKIMATNNIHAGATHLYLNPEEECYVVYASKTANFQLPGIDHKNSSFTMPSFKEYCERYGDLLICVGVDFPERGAVHSKGMFRNPASFLEKTHKGLSMVLRGFSGAVIQKYFPEKKTLNCTPLGSMQVQISSALQPDDYRVTGYSHQEALEFAAEMMNDGHVGEMPTNFIKISALDRLYRNHAAT